MTAFLTSWPLVRGLVQPWEDMCCLSELMSVGPDKNELLCRRMSQLGLEPDDTIQAEPALFLNLHRVCGLCDVRARCAADLKQHPDAPAWREYCPNAETLDMLNSLRSPKGEGTA